MAIYSALQARLQNLEDLELAILLCLVAEEHCIFTAENQSTSGSLLAELQLSCARTFGLRAAIVECSTTTSVDEFNNAILIEADDELAEPTDRQDSIARSDLRPKLPSFSAQNASRTGSYSNTLDHRRIANVIIARSLDCVNEDVQVQALELIRNGRIFSRSSMHVAPKDLVFITILSDPGARLSHHLHDLFALSHVYGDDSPASFERSPGKQALLQLPPNDIKHLREQLAGMEIIAEMAEYVHNIEVFLRNSRYIKSGVTATATRNLRTLSKTLALLHNLDYIPPSLVAMAAQKVYAHRIVLATPENEKTLLWGSDPEAIRQLLQDLTVEDVITEVIAGIEAPL